MDVRRLAAIDMHGTKGSPARGWIIRIEFALGAVLLPALGVGALESSSGVGWKVFGAWLIGTGLNYVPLAWHAVSLSRRNALEAELDGVDIGQGLRHYTKAQTWVFVPLALVVFSLRQTTD